MNAMIHDKKNWPVQQKDTSVSLTDADVEQKENIHPIIFYSMTATGSGT